MHLAALRECVAKRAALLSVEGECLEQQRLEITFQPLHIIPGGQTFMTGSILMLNCCLQVQLEVLCLCNSAPPLDDTAMGDLLRALCLLPRLHLLYFQGDAQMHFTHSMAALALFVDFVRGRGDVDLQPVADGPTRNPFLGKRMTWDAMEG